MKPGHESMTAVLVCMGRALADRDPALPYFSDPTAYALLPVDARVRVERVRSEGTKGLRSAIEDGFLMRQSKIMAARTLHIDRAIAEASAPQLVILGAGLDGRAWRMPELANVSVFEVDHPATQGEKRNRVPELPPAIGDVTFVPVDFERESLATVLDRAGHDRAVPTCWIWEGVVMYLTRDAMHATLADVGRRSAPGSTLIVNYHTAHRRFVARLILRLIGEPQISAWSPEEMSADLRSARFVVREDTGMGDWNQRFAQGQANVTRGSYMRIAIART